VLDLMPEFVEIITCEPDACRPIMVTPSNSGPGNDFGESSYICDATPRQIVQGAEKYVKDFPHSAFRAVLPYFIAAYKCGNRNMEVPHEDRAIAWYRTTPARCGSDGGLYVRMPLLSLG
jgi:glucan endo-1,3-alpha-glucosidase